MPTVLGQAPLKAGIHGRAMHSVVDLVAPNGCSKKLVPLSAEILLS